MSAVFDAPTRKSTAAAFDLSHWLDAAHSPWVLDFEQWRPADAQRWQAVLATSAAGQHVLLASRASDPLLLQWAEARLQRSLLWVQADAAALAHWLGEGESGFRALDLLESDGRNAAPSRSSTPELSALGLAAETSPVLRLLDSLLYDALQEGASDLHLETHAQGARVRYRIDGVMAEVRHIDGMALAEQLVSRLKVMAELDIGERRLPQDGRFKLRVQSREVDFRLSIMPSVFGEDAVVRLLDRSRIEQQGSSLSLQALGFDEATRGELRALAAQPHGMLLVTGPTGSGKTTTLYALLSETHSGAEKTITIEDPVEYQLSGVVQIPVNDKKGLSFARGLRSVLRHDPDRVMVGEIRDAETAQIAVQAALTGHVVFSSVHANSAFDVIGRFMHMGLDLYNVVSALNGVLAQRLVRSICVHCSQRVELPAAQAESLGLAGAELRRGLGCVLCRGSGYRGRKAVAELLRLDDGLRDLIAERAPMGHIRQAAQERGMQPLRQALLTAVRRGQTTLEELERVAPA